MKSFDVKLLREFSGLDQIDFWKKVGISQSGGSRYENHDRKLPKTVQELLRLVYIERVDLAQIKQADMLLLRYLKAEEKELLAELRKKAEGWVR